MLRGQDDLQECRQEVATNDGPGRVDDGSCRSEPARDRQWQERLSVEVYWSDRSTTQISESFNKALERRWSFMVCSLFRVVLRALFFGSTAVAVKVARRETFWSWGVTWLRARCLQRLVSMRPSSSASTYKLPPGL